jgi:hypothetical protein
MRQLEMKMWMWGRIRKRSKYLPMKMKRIRQFPNIQRAPLPYQLDMTRPSRRVVETNQHNVQLDVQHVSCALYLGLKPVHGATEHNHCPGDLQKKFFSFNDVCAT